MNTRVFCVSGPQQCMLCGNLAREECAVCFKDPLFSQTGFKVFCKTCSSQVPFVSLCGQESFCLPLAFIKDFLSIEYTDWCHFSSWNHPPHQHCVSCVTGRKQTNVLKSKGRNENHRCSKQYHALTDKYKYLKSFVSFSFGSL